MEFNVVERESRVSGGRLKEREPVERRRGSAAAVRRGDREEKKTLKVDRVAESGGKQRRRSAADMTVAR